MARQSQGHAGQDGGEHGSGNSGEVLECRVRKAGQVLQKQTRSSANTGLDRNCASFPTADALHDSDVSGLSPRVVVDLHKFLAMGIVSELSQQGASAVWTLELLDGLKGVVAMSSSCSPRVNLLLRSNGTMRIEGSKTLECCLTCNNAICRNLWGAVVEQSKNQVLREEAVKAADTVAINLDKLVEILKAGAVEGKDLFTEVETAVKDCSNAAGLLATCKAAAVENPDTLSKVVLVEDGLRRLRDVVLESYNDSSSAFRSFLETAWNSQLTFAEKDSTKQLLQRLMIEGWPYML